MSKLMIAQVAFALMLAVAAAVLGLCGGCRLVWSKDMPDHPVQE